MIYTTKWTLFVHCFCQLGISYAFGFLCAFSAEIPALNIEQILLTRQPKSALKPAPNTDCEVQLKEDKDILQQNLPSKA